MLQNLSIRFHTSNMLCYQHITDATRVEDGKAKQTGFIPLPGMHYVHSKSHCALSHTPTHT